MKENGLKQRYIVETVNQVPMWLQVEVQKGNATISTRDNGEILKITIIGKLGKMEAVPGDTILNITSGLIVLKKELADKYVDD